MNLRHLAGAFALAVTLGGAVPAVHAQYPPTVGNGRVTRSEVKQCQCVQFSGDGFQPGTTVTVVDRNAAGLERVVGTATVDTRGGFRLKVCFDENSAPGEHTLVGSGVQPDGGAHEVRATVTVEGTVCFSNADEVHNPSTVGGEDDEEQARGGSDGSGDGTGSGSGSGGGTGVGGVNLPRTGTDYVLPGLLLGFTLVVTGTGVVHLTRRRRLVTG